MRKAAIIVENRPLKNLFEIIEAHMRHLKGWDCILYDDEEINSPEDYNRLLTNPKFWDIDYDKILIFQHDSGILKKGADEFLDWDYVGSPWKTTASWARHDRAGGNGGLSIRDVKAHQKLLSEKQYNPKYGNEDVFFTHYLPNVAPYQVCQRFACETEYQLGTIGYHAIDKHLSVSECLNIKMQYIPTN